MGQEKVKVFHGTEESLVRALDSGQDFYYAHKPNLPTAVFSSDIRYSVIFAGNFTREKEYVTTWEIPLAILTLIDEGQDESKWYAPNLQVEEIETIPGSFLRKKGYKNIEVAKAAVLKGEVVFVHTPRQYYQGAEEVTKIMARFLSTNFNSDQ